MEPRNAVLGGVGRRRAAPLSNLRWSSIWGHETRGRMRARPRGPSMERHMEPRNAVLGRAGRWLAAPLGPS
eukprot:4258110-Pyramimonas_sp.AAC.1